ncbi:hypothetical protein [Bradyrhizobium sp. Leo121]|uniref:DUF6894 family protein n=1 Tax=Bradyrhizobium sp. Leo121 TaxID=1571195 RepID=UPI0010299C50|nr:hypothetical protein [Bradyrhizobium sp. Leo121]RZN09294.1 hypothetical protein CWO90_47330 [Bradyrhizobium sp. Leo121]
MQTFYFDRKDGVPIRDRIGKQFSSDAEAIEYSKILAAHFRKEAPTEPDLAIVVVSESGREIHREPVHPAGAS